MSSALDLGSDAEYRELLLRMLRGRPGTLDELALVAPDRRDLVDALRRLVSDGFAEGDATSMSVLPPDTSVSRAAIAALRQQQELTATVISLLDQLPELARSWDMGAAPGENALQGEVIEGDENALQRWFVLTSRTNPINPGASHPDLSFIHNHILPNLEQMREEFASRGYAIRYLFPASEMSDPENRRAADALLDINAPVRIATHLPSWFYVDKGIMAGLPQRWGATSPGGMVMAYSPALVDAFSWLFESWWEHATPYPVRSAGWESVLELLARGQSDKQIADSLDVGLRTVRRRIAEAMDDLGAPTRFELGPAWARYKDGH